MRRARNGLHAHWEVGKTHHITPPTHAVSASLIVKRRFRFTAPGGPVFGVPRCSPPSKRGRVFSHRSSRLHLPWLWPSRRTSHNMSHNWRRRTRTQQREPRRGTQHTAGGRRSLAIRTCPHRGRSSTSHNTRVVATDRVRHMYTCVYVSSIATTLQLLLLCLHPVDSSGRKELSQVLSLSVGRQVGLKCPSIFAAAVQVRERRGLGAARVFDGVELHRVALEEEDGASARCASRAGRLLVGALALGRARAALQGSTRKEGSANARTQHERA